MTQDNDNAYNAAPQDNVIDVIEVKLSVSQREGMALMAAQRAATVMTTEEWSAMRMERSDPFQADVEMCFGNPQDFKGGTR